MRCTSRWIRFTWHRLVPHMQTHFVSISSKHASISFSLSLSLGRPIIAHRTLAGGTLLAAVASLRRPTWRLAERSRDFDWCCVLVCVCDVVLRADGWPGITTQSRRVSGEKDHSIIRAHPTCRCSIISQDHRTAYSPPVPVVEEYAANSSLCEICLINYVCMCVCVVANWWA